MDLIEITILMLGVGNIVGMLAAYTIGWNRGYRAARKEER